MPTEMCPMCRDLRNMSVTTKRRKVVDPDGNTKEILTKTYHCATCGSFVRSEDIETEDDSSDKGIFLSGTALA